MTRAIVCLNFCDVLKNRDLPNNNISARCRNTQLKIRKIIIKLHEDGKVSPKIYSILPISKSTVNNTSIIKKQTETYCLEDKPVSGRPRNTTKRIDKLIQRKTVIDITKYVNITARKLRKENVVNISRRTVFSRLHEIGLTRRIGARKPF